MRDEGVPGAAAETLPFAGTSIASAHDSCPGRSASRCHGSQASVSRVAVVAIAVIAAVVAVIVCWKYLPGAYAWLANPDAVRAFVAEHAVLSRLVLGGINVMQVLLAFLPGEPVELASGYAFGLVEGTMLCLAAAAVASSLIYWGVRRWGWRLVGKFFDRSMIERYEWLRNTRKLELIMLIVFLIPGTPKDFLTYFAGLARLRFPVVLAIATFGRLPSIVTSTVAAAAFGAGDYGAAIAAVLVAGALIVAGGFAYRAVERRARRQRRF